MAITINNTPNNYQSFHDDLWFVVTSSNIAQPNFKYVFDVYVGATLVARVKSYPQPTTDKGLFNAATIVRNYWSSYFQPATAQTSFNYVGSGNRINYVVKYGEEYGGTLYSNLSETDTDAFNYYTSVLDGGTSFTGGYYDAYKGQVITKRSTFNTKLSGSRLFLSVLNTAINTPKDWRLSVIRYNSGTSTSSTGAFVSVSDLAVLDISPTAINTYLGSSFITSATDYYVVEVEEDIAGGVYLATVNIICESRFTTIPIHFLNSLGGYDTMNFTLVNRQSRNAEKKSFEQIDWQYRSSDMFRYNQYNVFNGGSTQFVTAQTISYKLTSDWVTLLDYTWLRDLIMSPEVYMEQGGYFIPVSITTSNWSEKKQYADKIYNLELDIQLGSKEFSQFR